MRRAASMLRSMGTAMQRRKPPICKARAKSARLPRAAAAADGDGGDDGDGDSDSDDDGDESDGDGDNSSRQQLRARM